MKALTDSRVHSIKIDYLSTNCRKNETYLYFYKKAISKFHLVRIEIIIFFKNNRLIVVAISPYFSENFKKNKYSLNFWHGSCNVYW